MAGKITVIITICMLNDRNFPPLLPTTGGLDDVWCALLNFLSCFQYNRILTMTKSVQYYRNTICNLGIRSCCYCLASNLHTDYYATEVNEWSLLALSQNVNFILSQPVPDKHFVNAEIISYIVQLYTHILCSYVAMEKQCPAQTIQFI